MVLGFKKHFVAPIDNDIKIHTIRRDEKGRWKAGNEIHFATGVRTKNYNQFKLGKCISTQKIEIIWRIDNKGLANEGWSVQVYIDGENVVHKKDAMDTLVKNDGFKDRREFFEWESWHKKDFTGKIIHWTNFRY